MTVGTVLVTGAARGIGAAIARRLAVDGWSLVLLDRCEDDPALSYSLASPADLDGVVSACRDLGGETVGLVGDVRDIAAVSDAVATAVDVFGGLTAAVSAAGCLAGGRPAWETEPDEWSTVIGVNLNGVWNLARAAVPAILETPEPRHGRFVAVSSTAGTVGMPLLSAYVAAKHGVNGLIRSMAAELGERGVTANAVAPGSTLTKMLEASSIVYGLPDTDGLITQHLLRRPLEPSEVAELVGWICGPTSSGVTGAILPVDAGVTAQ